MKNSLKHFIKSKVIGLDVFYRGEFLKTKQINRLIDVQNSANENCVNRVLA